MLKLLHKTPKKSAYLIIIFLAIFSTIYNAFLPLHGDEAYYWMWSHHLQAGYFDHPSMIAYMIYLTNFISQAEWGVRLVNIFSFSISALYIFKLTSKMFDEKTALNALLVFSSIIIVNAGYIITTTDSPLILFWTLSLYFSYMALFYKERKYFIFAGITIGLMMISKYTSILFVFALLLFIALKKREILFNINIYISTIISLIIISPMLYWNYQHEWISFVFQLDHGSTDNFELNLNAMFEYIGGQFLAFSPLFAALLFYYTLKNKLFFKDDKLFFLSLFMSFTLGFFLYKSMFTFMGLNYAAPAYVSGVILLAYIVSKYELEKSFRIGLYIAIFLTLVGRFGIMFYLEIFQDRMYGNREAVFLTQTYVKDGDAIYGDHLTTAAYLKYYLKGKPDTDIATDSRFSQYDMWRSKDFIKNGLVLTLDTKENALKKIYKNVILLDTLTVQRGLNRTKTFYIYRVSTPLIND